MAFAYAGGRGLCLDCRPAKDTCSLCECKTKQYAVHKIEAWLTLKLLGHQECYFLYMQGWMCSRRTHSHEGMREHWCCPDRGGRLITWSIHERGDALSLLKPDEIPCDRAVRLAGPANAFGHATIQTMFWPFLLATVAACAPPRAIAGAQVIP